MTNIPLSQNNIEQLQLILGTAQLYWNFSNLYGDFQQNTVKTQFLLEYM